MNRCSVCDKTDEDNPKADIKYVIHGRKADKPPTGEFQCSECRDAINTEVTNEIEYFQEFAVPEAIVYDDSWVEAPLHELPEQ